MRSNKHSVPAPPCRAHRTATKNTSETGLWVVQESGELPATLGSNQCIKQSVRVLAKEAMRLAREAIRQRADFVGAHRVLTAALARAIRECLPGYLAV
jgi:hypothetical protein